MIYNISKLVVNFFLLFTGDEMTKSFCTGQGHLIVKISQNIGHVHILRLIV